MIESIAKILIKSTGLFTVFVFACEHLNLLNLYKILQKFEIDSIQRFYAETAFMFLCIIALYVLYYMLSDIAKTLSEGLSLLNKHRKSDKQIDKQTEVINELKDIMRQVYYKLDRENSSPSYTIRRVEELPRENGIRRDDPRMAPINDQRKI